MELKQCKNGHFYESTLDSCPICSQETASQADNYRKTEPFRFGEVEDYGATEPVNESILPRFSAMGGQNLDVTRPAFDNNQPGFLPVVGWLVCIEGPEKGQDYRIHSGYNNIGRSPSMDIVLKFDNNISREKDCYIGYDQEEKEFFFGHDNGKNIIRVNGKRVNGSVDLNTYDILTIGSCKYMFVALCGKQFDWSE